MANESEGEMNRHLQRYMGRERALELVALAFAGGCLLLTFVTVVAVTR